VLNKSSLFSIQFLGIILYLSTLAIKLIDCAWTSSKIEFTPAVEGRLVMNAPVFADVTRWGVKWAPRAARGAPP
jgi:hypothetical protein